MDEKYAAQLIKVIGQKTPLGEHTIHWTGGSGAESFNPYFLQAGFERVRQDETGSNFMVYRKKIIESQ